MILKFYQYIPEEEKIDFSYELLEMWLYLDEFVSNM